MSKRGYISRYMLLIKRLKAKPYTTFEELITYVTRQLETLYLQDDKLLMGFSKRTLQRDIREIRTLFGIDIIYDTARKGYYINSTAYESSGFQRMIEAFDVFNSLNMTSDMAAVVAAEPRRPAGTEHMYGLLHAIKNHLQVHFRYHKFWNDEVSWRTAEPWLLKEFRNRWYLITVKSGGQEIKTFALDRISELEITSQKFTKNQDVDLEAAFRDSFGIIGGDGSPSQQIVLSFDPIQGKYIKSLPLHISQQVLIDNDEELRIALQLHLTHDLLMEIRSFGEDVEVIAPEELKQQICDSLKRAAELY